MERIAYKDCGECHGKGWYYDCEWEQSKIECADCALKNDTAALRKLLRAKTLAGDFDATFINRRQGASLERP